MNTRSARVPAQTLGIMVCPVAGDPPIPEKSYFRRLALLARGLGMTVFVFSPNRVDWERRRVVGYAYSTLSRRWEKRVYPLPNVVYDRCFYADARTYAAYREPIRRLVRFPGVRFLGYGLKGKWDVHQMLITDDELAPYLPETEPMRNVADVSRWLEEKGELFLKPHGGSHGKGVLRIREVPHGYILTGRNSRNETVRLGFRSRSRMLAWVRRFTSGRRYLIQRYLTLTTKDGVAFDIRALVQKNGKGRWELTGLAVRQGAPGSVTSNLHGGGRAEEAEPFLRRIYGAETASRILETVRRIAMRVPETLERHHGRLAELGVDIGVDADGSVWLLEANSKPGRSSFSALSDKRASETAVRNPLLYAKFMLDTRGHDSADDTSSARMQS